MLFNDPALNLRANYTLFDRATTRPLCVGDGQTRKRMTAKGVEHPCEDPDLCALAIEGWSSRKVGLGAPGRYRSPL